MLAYMDGVVVCIIWKVGRSRRRDQRGDPKLEYDTCNIAFDVEETTKVT